MIESMKCKSTILHKMALVSKSIHAPTLPHKRIVGVLLSYLL